MEGREISLNQEQAPNQEKLKVDCYASTIASRNHPDHNEDAYFFDSSKGIFGIFDGMGGMQDGQWSAETSNKIIRDSLEKNHHPYPLNANRILTSACKGANEEVFKEKRGNGGTTATFGFLCETTDGVSQVALAHVGDSRAYLFRDGKLSKLTIDDNGLRYSAFANGQEIQSKLDNIVSTSEMTDQEQVLFRRRNEINNFIGIDADINPKIIIQSVLPKDILILTTDGIHDNLTTTEISEIISQNSKNPSSITEKLTQKALERSREGVVRSKSDDMSAEVVVFSKKENDATTQEIAPQSKEFTPKVGQEITLQRTSGDIESGWRIFFQQDGVLGVQKKDAMKRVKVGDIERFNRPAEIKDISTSKNIEQLKYTIKKLGGLTGSRYYSSDDLLTLIDNTIANKGSKESLQYLTGAGDLRKTAERLIEESKKQ